MTSRWFPLGLALLAKLLVGLTLLASGFHAISDDDFARISIAQDFAADPRLDPSGTSWLPFPFWVTGSAMLAAGKSLQTARVVAVVLGLLATGITYASGRWLGFSRATAALGAALGSLFPYAAFLGVAAVPEALTAACVVAGAVSAGRSSPRVRFLGAALLLTATLSRYEAWPVALGFALVCAWDALRGAGKAARHSEVEARLGDDSNEAARGGARSEQAARCGGAAHSEEAARSEAAATEQAAVCAGLPMSARAAYLAAAGLCLSGAAAWMLHGVVHHQSATFFVERVAAYRRAIGAAPDSLWQSLTGYPLGFFRGEPELVLSAICISLGLLVWQRRRAALSADELSFGGEPLGSASTQPWRRPVLLLGVMLVSLIYGDVRDGAPTHHSERAVLALWVLCGLWLAQCLSRSWALAKGQRWQPALLLALSVGLGAAILRPWYSQRDSFIDRTDAVEIGAAARSQGAPKLGILSPDYGFFAVMVGFERPSAATRVGTADKPRGLAQAPFSVTELRAEVLRKQLRWLVVPREHAELARTLGQVEHEAGGWLLVAVPAAD